MRVFWCKARERFEAASEYSERHELKAAGFRWDPENRCWWTADLEAAGELIQCADEGTAELVRARLAEKTAVEECAIEASRALDAKIDVPSPLGKSYYGYQLAGIAYASARRDTLIADEMGLGKTIQAIGVVNIALEASDHIRVLVVAPKIALPNWERELREWLIKNLSIARWTMAHQASADIVVVNYDILSRAEIIGEIRVVDWDVVVFDEAHALKNPKAKRTKAAFGDRQAGTPQIQGKRRLFLTGTPILNRPIELFPMLNAMGVTIAQNYYGYARRYCNGHTTMRGFDVSGASNLDELQHVLRATCMVRRLKADVLTQLPPKRYELVEFDAVDRQTCNALANERESLRQWSERIKALKESRNRAGRAGNKEALRDAVAELAEGERARLAQISRLRHETAIAKVSLVIEHVVGVLASTKDAVLLFAHHRDVIAKLRDGLATAGYEAAVITGQTGEPERLSAQAEIKDGEKRLFIGSMHACGVAINLPEASTVVFAEQDWTPTVMSQCEDRAHRIGQRNSVLVQHLVLAGSIDADEVYSFLSNDSIDPQMAKTASWKEGVIEQALDRAEPGREGNNVPGVTKLSDTGDAQIASPGVSAGEAKASVQAPSVAGAKRKRGRPSAGGKPLTKTERNRRWRKKAERVSVELPREVVDQLRRVRGETQMTTAEILIEALSRFEAEHQSQRPSRGQSSCKLT